MEVHDALRALGGAARWKQLRAHVTRAALQDAAAAGRVVKERRVWRLVDTDRGLTAAVEMRGVRSHRSAAEFWHFALPPTTDPRHDVTIPPKAKRAHVPSDVHLRYRDLPIDVRAVGVTSPAQTVLDCLRDLPLRDALSVGDSALRSGLVEYDELAHAVSRARGPGARRARTRFPLLDARAENAFESSMRALLIEAGLLGFRPQVTVRHRGSWLGRVDLADPLLQIVIECEGFEYHGKRARFRQDMVRFTCLVAAGWRPLRFAWEQVMFEPEWVVARVLETVADVGRPTRTTEQRPKKAAQAAA